MMAHRWWRLRQRTSWILSILPALAHDRVEGTVTLYAVIRRDGTVGDIRVLHSVDKLLDYSAMRALAGWRFLPGMKNGSAVDLEAVVEIPFHLKPMSY